MKSFIKRKMDWEGLKVVSNHRIKNGYGELPKGTVYTVNSYSRGLSLSSEACKCCDFKLNVARVDISSVTIIHCEYNKERIEWNKKRKIERSTFGNRVVNPPEQAPIYNQ